MKKIPFLSALLLLSFPALAQQTWTNGFFPFNRFIFNPAFTSLNEKIQVDAQYGKTSSNIQLATQFQIPSIHSGFGLHYLRIGFTTTRQLSYSYYHFLGKEKKYRLSYGANLGYNSFGYYLLDIAGDTTNGHWTSKYTYIGSGLTFSTKDDKVYVGLASTNLLILPNKKSNIPVEKVTRLTLNAGYRFDIKEFSIQPNIMYQYYLNDNIVRLTKADNFSFSNQFKYRWLNIGVGMNSNTYTSILGKSQIIDYFISTRVCIIKHWTLGFEYQHHPVYSNKNRLGFILSYVKK